MDNKQVANHLNTIAQLMSMDGANHFKVSAYENAADVVKKLKDPVEDIIGKKKIQGIGKSITDTIVELLQFNTSQKYQGLVDRLPIKALDLTIVEGIGPKVAYKLYQQGFTTLKSLIEAAETIKLPYNLNKAVLAIKNPDRVPHLIAKDFSWWVVEQIKDSLLQVEVCGSIRRKTETSKDIDIVGCVNNSTEKPQVFEIFNKIGSPINGGDARGSINATYQARTLKVDLWLCEPWYWGTMLNYVTGSRDHNKKMRGMAQEKGMKINEYGIYLCDERLGGENEFDIYNILGIPYVEPENRV